MKLPLKPRLVDFRWYYNVVWMLDSYRAHAIAFTIASWLSRTFNLILITSMTDDPRNKIV